MGGNRELKKANEAYWAGKLSQDDLLKEAKRIRLENWKIQKDAGVDVIPSNDFAFYDHILDHIQLFNVSHTSCITLWASLTAIGHPRAILQEQPR
jgi:5-methyltetrahydropteroyltriglutamate--homocysteine methyltransferase